MEPEKEINILDRQPNESEIAWMYYLRYRDEIEKPRRKSHLKCNGGDSYAKILKWSKEFKWDERCRIYDSELDKQKRDAAKKATFDNVKSTLSRHANNARAYGAITMTIQKKILELINKPEGGALDGIHILKLLDYGLQSARILPALQQEERNAMGINPLMSMVTDKEVSKMTDEELQQYISSLEGLAGISNG